MRALQVIILVATLVGAGAIVIKATRDAMNETADLPAEPDPEPAEDSPPDPKETGDARTVPPPATGLTNAQRTVLRDEVAHWAGESSELEKPLVELLRRARRVLRDSPPDEVDRLREDLDLAARWFLLRELRARLKSATPEASFQRVSLSNGKTLYAASIENRPDGSIALRTVSGIDATFRADQIDTVRAIDRVTYFRQTADTYREKLAALDPSRPSDLERGIELSLCREDLETARRLFESWLEVGGPRHLLRVTSVREAPGPHYAAAYLEPERPLAEVPDGGPPDEETALGKARPRPVSLEDLEQKIQGAHRRLATKAKKRERQVLHDDLVTWEEWLENNLLAQAQYPDKVRDLRRALQLLRLDLLKTSGF